MFILRVVPDDRVHIAGWYHWEATCEICGEVFLDLDGFELELLVPKSQMVWRVPSEQYMSALHDHWKRRNEPGKGCQWKATFDTTT